MIETVAKIKIAQSGVWFNDQEIAVTGNFSAITRELYNQLDCQYPKFFKMDDLSKLGFISTELLLSQAEVKKQWESSQVAIIVGNKTGSIISDVAHQNSINDTDNYFPSPAIFVYTLSNIMLGEICIRHQITGENSCFIMESFDKDFIMNYANNLLQDSYSFCIAGWIEHGLDHYESELWLLAGNK